MTACFEGRDHESIQLILRTDGADNLNMSEPVQLDLGKRTWSLVVKRPLAFARRRDGYQSGNRVVSDALNLFKSSLILKSERATFNPGIGICGSSNVY